MTYDRRAIMHAAWGRVRKANRARFPLRVILRNALRGAWMEAKQEAARAAQPVSSADMQILCIECKERLAAADLREIERLRFGSAAA